MNLKYIKDYWNNSAKKSKISSEISQTSRDPFLADLERSFVISCLKKNYHCLEIGCGDAINTFHYIKNVKSILATDNSENLLKIANKKLKLKKIKNLTFENLSAIEIPKTFINKFNCVISQRCIINLSTWDNQKNTIKKVHSSLKKNGVFVLTEGFEDRLNNLNILRNKFGLKKINVAKYNKFLKVNKFEKYIKKYFKIKRIYNYGSYTILSHLFHPLIVSPNNPLHNSKINEISMMFQKNNVFQNDIISKYSYNIGYLLTKK